MAVARRKSKPKKPRARGGPGARPVPRAVPTSRQQRALADVTRVLERLDYPAAIIGGIAVIAWGRARATEDVDVAISAPLEDLTEIFQAFLAAGFESRNADALGFARESLVLLLRHKATGIPLDLSLAQLLFERAALQAAVARPWGKLSIKVPRVSDLIIYKLIASRPQDLLDVEALLDLGHEVDDARIDATLREFDALLDTDRADTWARLRREAS